MNGYINKLPYVGQRQPTRGSSGSIASTKSYCLVRILGRTFSKMTLQVPSPSTVGATDDDKEFVFANIERHGLGRQRILMNDLRVWLPLAEVN